jgi:Domain of unknown function (DUF4157)
MEIARAAERRSANPTTQNLSPATSTRRRHTPGPHDTLLALQRSAGNQAVEALLRSSRAAPPPVLQRCGGHPCPPGGCDQDDGTIQRHSTGTGPAAIPASVNGVLSSPGSPLAPRLQASMQDQLGHDFTHVRVHTDAAAADSARDVQARAYTVGAHVVFGAGQYHPDTNSGHHLLMHELAHVIQQRSRHWTPNQSLRISQPSDTDEVAAEHWAADTTTPVAADTSGSAAVIHSQLDPSMCATDCTGADAARPATGKYQLTIFVDNEGPFLLMPFTEKVGHAWVELSDKDGNYWTYGFWPQTQFDAKEPAKDVPGCVWKGEQGGHTPTAQQTFELTKEEFDRAHALAISLCASRPKYNLFGLQCTEFARRILDAAGKGTALGFGLIFQSPAALDSWLRSNQLVIGASVTAATTAAGGQGAGTVGLHAEYTHQFLAALGNKLRLQWIARGELSQRMASLTTGAGIEVTTQRVYLPRAYLLGGVTAGELTPGEFGSGTDRFGAGVTAAAGLRYNIDEFATVGVEVNVVKDLISNDPALGRLMVTAGFHF